MIKLGDSGTDVFKLQQTLQTLGILKPGFMKGQFDQSTLNVKDILQQLKTAGLSDTDIPNEEYIQFVKLANGLDFNGLIVYSINKVDDNNIYSANEIWHENKNLTNYIFFADSDIAWLCYDCNQSSFCELDKPSGTLMNTFSSFSEMMKSALQQIH